jgi:hypothetical protein
MSKVETIERQVQELPTEDLAQFRHWFTEFDADAWDRQMESDVKAGKLNALAEEALKQHAAGRTTKL